MSIPLSDHVTASSLGSLKFPPSPPHNRHEHELSSLTKSYDSCHHQQHHHLSSKGLGGTRISQVEITSFYSPANSLYEPDGTSTIASTPPMSGIQHINGSSTSLQPPSVSRVLPRSQSTIASLCLQCKGHKYGFTSYFHNTAIFPEPPHDLLMLVEQSYLLRNRLKSLMINYVTRRVDNSRLEAIANEILDWKGRVECLAREVLVSSMGFELNMEGLEAVNDWAADLVQRLGNHVNGFQRMELSKEDQKKLLIDFKKLWEVVWTSFMADRNKRNTPRRSLRSRDAVDLDSPDSEL
ncbi:uncharacterized protein EAE98_003354 [Botrytis deweyae]|uniref:Uncharacterized protein n=1 Tax=Botrytis deweyae TaxID=2478750 RepID=A0ABQ7ITB6_9HELO|nr:uncharacterized protein EAE98_003354 [Botrytis deweyae]KAF7933645.1 hypothetical protein EAE98_003354 [Botrytis deweyae]